MGSFHKLELELKKLFQQKEYSKIIFEITSQTKEEERSSFFFNLLGLCRITNNNKNKEELTLALRDFKLGYLKEKNTNNALDSLANFIITSVLLIDLDKNFRFDYSEIISFYEESERFSLNHRQIHLAMCMVYRRFSYSKKLVFHFDKIIKSKNFTAADLCNYGYWHCFDTEWNQSDFFTYGKFLDENLKEISKDKLTNFSVKNGSKIRIGFLL